MKLDLVNNVVKFDSDREELVMRFALANYKDYLESNEGIWDVDYVSKQNLKTVSEMLDEFQYVDDTSEG